MQDTELIEKVAHLEEREKSNTKRLDEVEIEIKENRELTIAVKEIATEMKHLREDQSNMNDRLKLIEEKPSKNWDNLKWLIITRSCNSCFRFFTRKIRVIKRRDYHEYPTDNRNNNSSSSSNSLYHIHSLANKEKRAKTICSRLHSKS